MSDFNHSKQSVLSVALPAFALVVGLIGQVMTSTMYRDAAAFFLLFSLTSWAFLLHSAYRSRFGGLGWVMLMIFTLALMVAFPPATSKDFNSYAAYGRMVSVYHLNPYAHGPIDIPNDLWFPRVSPFWAATPSVYGPLFTAMLAVVTSVTGQSIDGTRIALQLLEAAALVIAVAVVARELRNVGLAVVLLGVNPLIVTFGVNDAHCDVLVGTCILLGAVLLQRHARWAACAFVAAVGIKIVAFPALVGAAIWIACNRGWRASAAFLAVSIGLFVGCMSIADGWSLYGPLKTASARESRFSLFAPLHNYFGLSISLLASIAVAVCSLLLMKRYRNMSKPYLIVAAALVSYQMFGSYVLSWYAIWSLPVLALVWRSRLAFIAMAWGCGLALGYFSGYALLVVLIPAGMWTVSRFFSRRRTLPWLKSSDSPILARS